MDKNITRNTRVVVTGGPYKGRTGLAIRPDGTLRGKPVWLVKLDNSMLGTSIETRYMVPESGR